MGNFVGQTEAIHPCVENVQVIDSIEFFPIQLDDVEDCRVVHNIVVVGGISNTASGAGSAVVGGHGNVAVGYDASVIGGGYNCALGDYSVAFGNGAYASGVGDLAFGYGPVGVAGPLSCYNEFYFCGCSAEMHVGRQVNQAVNAGETNTLFLHSPANGCQSLSVGMKANPAMTATYCLILPLADGSPGQSLKTCGNGCLYWA